MDRNDLADDPLAQIQHWLDEAVAAGVYEPNAMSLATSKADGSPNVRTVLLKGVDSGLVFFTNYHSMKARELEWSGRAAVSLTWPTLGRQVRVRGTVERTSAQESDDYFASRARGSQLAAWASSQSEAVVDRAALDQRYAEAVHRFPGAVPRPPHWGGYRITPDEVEFWSRRDNRMHDRLRFTRQSGGAWRVDRLAP